MKFLQLIFVIISAAFITACSNNNLDTNRDTKNVEIIKKYEAVELPVTIYTKKNYYPGEDVIFTRTIESIEVNDFSENTAIDFFDRYDNKIKRMNLDLINDFKRVKILMSHNIEGTTTKTPFEPFILDENSEVILNKEPILDEVVTQQVFLTTLDYRMGSTHDKKGEIILAIPKEYFKENLQLKTISRNDKKKEVIYIDLK